MITKASVSLRPETTSDANFIEELYISTRDESDGWRLLLPTERTRLLKEQSALQLIHYEKNFPHAWRTIIEVNGKPAGRFYVNQTPKEMRIVDIAILPEFRQHGIGSKLIKQVIAESIRLQLPLRLRAEKGSPVISYYQRLGFRQIEVEATTVHFQWRSTAKD